MASRLSHAALRLLGYPGQRPPRSFSVQRPFPSICNYAFLLSQRRHYANGYGGGPQLPGQVAPQPGQPEEPDEDSAVKGTGKGDPSWRPTLLKMFESAATTMVSLSVLGYEIQICVRSLHC